LAALTRAHLEKEMALRAASSASAAAQAEVYRSAILDALAHEFKTPLTTILAAAGGLREAGSLGPEQLELAETVETEAERLGRLSSRLLRMARLDREEVRPRIEATDMQAVIRHLAEQYARQWPDRQISTVNHGEPAEESVDPELLRLAVSQLLDNACKYSLPGAAIRVAMESDPDGFIVEVSNSSSFIPASEQGLIFERFYRGAEMNGHTSGSGLGLYVARKIALAHGGTLSLVPDAGTRGEVTFRLNIPGSRTLSAHVATSQ
jgi:two-component system sensor histidine kinase KdpD